MKNLRIPVAKEGFISIKVFFGLSVVFYIIGYEFKLLYFFSALFFLLTIFTIFFFRDPERKITEGENFILSPADGKILDIKNEDNPFVPSPAKVIKIFMSPFNMHIQRAPMDGIVSLVKYQPGLFLKAYQEEASEKNEQNLIGIEFVSRRGSEGLNFRILVKQIAGILARRIVCWTKEKDMVAKGQRLGLIKFGSQVDLYLPENVNLKVKKGDKVKAGITVIAELSL